MYNINVKSEYSFLYSNIKLDNYITKAKEDGYTSLFLCDNNMHASYKFIKHCNKHNITPIIGIDTYLSHNGLTIKTLLYYNDTKGYQELLKLSSKDMATDSNITTEDIKNSKYIDVVVVIDNTLRNSILQSKFEEIEYVIKSLKSFNPNTYIGIDYSLYSNKSIFEKLQSFANVLLADESRYLTEDDKNDFISMQKVSKRNININHNYHLKTQSEFEQQYPLLVSNHTEFANKSISIEFNDNYMPSLGEEASLYDKCIERLKQLQLIDNSEYKDRLDYEYKIIKELNYTDYFLVVADFIKYAKDNNIYIGPGRGSACGSIISYLLDITEVDPIEYGLLFERFLNPERVTMPDIDIDIEDRNRNKVIEYIENKYSSKNVCSISTFNKIKPKSAINMSRSITEIDDISYGEISSRITDKTRTIKSLYGNEEIKPYLRHESVRNLLSHAASIDSHVQNTSTHAAGIIISNKRLSDIIPLTKGSQKVLQSQYEAYDLEDIGLVKMDLLSLSNLSFLKDIVESVKIQDSKFNLKTINLEDPKTYKLFQLGLTSSIFQVDSSGMKKVLKDLNVSSFSDLVMTLAIYRPGPMDNIPLIADRKMKKAKTIYIHPLLEPILNSTYGIIVYQEQIMQILQTIAGYSYGEADILRRAISKKQESVIEEERLKFINHSKNKGIKEDIANLIYSDIAKFAQYGFNKSHAVAYAHITYQLMYLKANYPLHFYKVLIDYSVGNNHLLSHAIHELYVLRINVLKLDVFKSSFNTTIEDTNLRLGFNTQKQLKNLDLEKPQSFNDFITLNKDKLTYPQIESLIYTSSLDNYKLSKKKMIETYEDILLGFTSVIDKSQIKDINSEFEISYLSKKELEYQSYNFLYHILDRFADYIKEKKISTPSNLSNTDYIKVMGVIDTHRIIKTKKGDSMCFMTIEDKFSKIDLTLFKETLSQIDKLEDGNIIYAECKKSTYNDKISYVVNRVRVTAL